MRICTERCWNQRLLPSVAKLDLGTFCSVPLPLKVAPLGSGCCSHLRDVTPTRGCMNVPLGNSLALVSSYREAPRLSPHLGLISSRQTLHKHFSWNPPLPSILEKIFCELGWMNYSLLFIELYAVNSCRCIKKSITVQVRF